MVSLVYHSRSHAVLVAILSCIEKSGVKRFCVSYGTGRTQIMQQVKQNLDDRFHAIAMEWKCCEAVSFIAVKDVCCIRAVMFCDLKVVLEFVHFVKQALHV